MTVEFLLLAVSKFLNCTGTKAKMEQSGKCTSTNTIGAREVVGTYECAPHVVTIN